MLKSSNVLAISALVALTSCQTIDNVGNAISGSVSGIRSQFESTDKRSETSNPPAAESATTAVADTASPAASSAHAEGFVTPGDIVDGDTIKLGKKRIRLHGIDAPELDQQCQLKEQIIACGKISRHALIGFTVGALVQCDRIDIDRYGRDVSRCSAEGLDISSAMVRSGHAVAYREYSLDYVTDEDSAKGRKFGMWKGAFQMPWEWRAFKRQNKKS